MKITHKSQHCQGQGVLAEQPPRQPRLPIIPQKGGSLAVRINRSFEKRLENALARTGDVHELLTRNKVVPARAEQERRNKGLKKSIQIVESRLVPMGKRYLELMLSINRLDIVFRKDHLYRLEVTISFIGSRLGPFNGNPVLKYELSHGGHSSFRSSVSCDYPVTKDDIKIVTQSLDGPELFSSIFVFKGGFLPAAEDYDLAGLVRVQVGVLDVGFSRETHIGTFQPQVGCTASQSLSFISNTQKPLGEVQAELHGRVKYKLVKKKKEKK